jgi:hypothetical protein
MEAINLLKQSLESVPGTNQDQAMNVKFLAQGINDLPLTGFKPMRPEQSLDY